VANPCNWILSDSCNELVENRGRKILNFALNYTAQLVTGAIILFLYTFR